MGIESLDILKKKGLLPSAPRVRPAALEIPGFDLEDQIFIKSMQFKYSEPEKLLIRQQKLVNPFYPEKLDLEKLVFFDTETTGLSTGAGSVIFLAGLGFIREDCFQIYQFFLENYHKEFLFLKKILALFNQHLVVSYNGKSYDIPLLKSRIIFQNNLADNDNNEKLPELQLLEHLDLLHYCRRLYRSELINFSLSNVEQKVLNISRHNDISGAEVPLVYFDFLKSGQVQALSQVFSHNTQDIYSLFKLLVEIVSLFLNKDYSKIDALGTSRYFIRQKQFSQAEEILTSQYHAREIKNKKMLSLLYKKKKNWSEACRLWFDLIYEEQDFDYYPYEELAKYFEHREKQISQALQIVDKALKKMEVLKSLEKFIDINVYQQFQHRKLRLLKKISHRLTD